MLFANHNNLDNVIAIVDHNKMQSMDFCEKTISKESLADKWKAFGWNVFDINGNDHEQLKTAFSNIQKNKKPTVIIANTVKGYGIPFMENDILWHYRFPHDGWEYDTAVTELHKIKPEGVQDIYTPNGIENPVLPTENDDIYNDHTTSATWKPTWMNEREEN
jgi:transketolase